MKSVNQILSTLHNILVFSYSCGTVLTDIPVKYCLSKILLDKNQSTTTLTVETLYKSHWFHYIAHYYFPSFSCKFLSATRRVQFFLWWPSTWLLKFEVMVIDDAVFLLYTAYYRKRCCYYCSSRDVKKSAMRHRPKEIQKIVLRNETNEHHTPSIDTQLCFRFD